jgi:hypothetical protein
MLVTRVFVCYSILEISDYSDHSDSSDYYYNALVWWIGGGGV